MMFVSDLRLDAGCAAAENHSAQVQRELAEHI